MICPTHGEYTGLQCKPCFIGECEQRELRHFKTDSTAVFKTIFRDGKKHAVLSGWGKKTLCGHKFGSLNDLSFPIPRDQMAGNVTCRECVQIGWPGSDVSKL
jgi:hypothetical protein